MTGRTQSEFGIPPLATRLRDEAAGWDEGESIPPLLIEAAEAIELLAARVAELTWALEAICDIGETRDVQVARAALDGRRIPSGDVGLHESRPTGEDTSPTKGTGSSE